MKYILLPEKSENANYYKANLHCHSVISDGRKTPEQIKTDYVAHGYSIVAYTDHNMLIGHNDLTDDNFLALNGFEIDVGEKHRPKGEANKVCHICFISPSADNLRMVCYHRTENIWGNALKYRDVAQYDESLPDFIREYSANGVNAMIEEARENGCFITYNHPTWSLENYPCYNGYDGMDAMEIVNYGCVVGGYDDDNGHCYNDFLNQGKRIFCIAADDNHNAHPDTHEDCDSYGGYTVICSPSLNYDDVFAALKSGMFYSSTGTAVHCGPEILSLTYEDGKVSIKTSGVRSVYFITNLRYCNAKNAPFGELIEEADFEIKRDIKWFRLVVVDKYGYKAYTNAYFIDSLDSFKSE